MIGIAAAGVIALVVAIFGLIKPGGDTSWEKPGTLLTVKESGERFLYLGGLSASGRSTRPAPSCSPVSGWPSIRSARTR